MRIVPVAIVFRLHRFFELAEEPILVAFAVYLLECRERSILHIRIIVSERLEDQRFKVFALFCLIRAEHVVAALRDRGFLPLRCTGFVKLL